MMKSRHLIFAASLACASCAGVGNAQDGWPDAKASAGNALEAGECAAAWDFVWPEAKAGTLEARAILSTGVYSVGLMPPAAGRDAVNRYRTALVLSAHSAGSGDGAANELLLSLLEADPGMGGASLSECLSQADADASACVGSAVESGYLPSFDAYAAEIDAIAAASPSVGATCDVPIVETLPTKQ